MPLVPERRSLREVQDSVRSKLETRLGVKLTSDSKVKAIVDSFISEIVDIQNSQASYFESMNISSAQGSFLDSLAAEEGMTRLSSTFASCSSTTECVAFYVASGTFGDLNSGADFTIPAGTIISTRLTNVNTQSSISYTVKEDTTCASGSSIVFVSVKAVLAGSLSNVGTGALNVHNYTGVTGYPSLLVINFYPILNGRDKETDEILKYRIAQKYTSLISKSEISAELKAISTIPGVLATKVIPGYYGLGTCAVIVIGPDYQTNDAILNLVQTELDEMATPGMRMVAIAANSVSIDFELDIRPNETLTEADKTRIRTSLNDSFREIFKGGSLGESISMRTIRKEIRKTLKTIISKSRNNSTDDIFKKVIINRGSPTIGYSSARKLEGESITCDDTEYIKLGNITINYL